MKLLIFLLAHIHRILAGEILSQGQICDNTSTTSQCADGLKCSSFSDVVPIQRCFQVSSVGGPCHEENVHPKLAHVCDDSLLCVRAISGSRGRCFSVSGLGGPCDENNGDVHRCAEGLVCDRVYGDPNGYCQFKE